MAMTMGSITPVYPTLAKKGFLSRKIQDYIVQLQGQLKLVLQ